MCDLLPEGHYQNCNHENATYLYYFMGNVTIAMTWELALKKKKLKMPSTCVIM